MKSKASRVLIGLLLVFVSDAYAGSAPYVSIGPAGKTAVTATSGKVNIKVEVVTHEVTIKESDRGNTQIPVTACTYSRFPCSLVDNLSIVVNGTPVFVQHSVFLDLSDINTARIQIGKSKYILTLEGGDASESYKAIIEFDKERVKAKRIYDGESGGLLRETVYHLVVN